MLNKIFIGLSIQVYIAYFIAVGIQSKYFMILYMENGPIFVLFDRVLLYYYLFMGEKENYIVKFCLITNFNIIETKIIKKKKKVPITS